MDNNIPNYFYSQAVRSRGTNIKEKLNYLLNWYINNSQLKASDKYQRDFIDIMVNTGNLLKSLLVYDSEEDTKRAILSYIPVSNYQYQITNHRPHKDFYAYLTVELGKITE